MPSTRVDRNTLYRPTDHLSLGESVFQPGKASKEGSLRTPRSLSATPTKKKKSRNAFILFRSHAIANDMLPKGIIHQNDVSRCAAALWREQDDETRMRFFRLAEEEKARWMMDDGSGFEIVKKKRTRAARPSKRKPVAQMPTPPSSPHSVRDMPVSPAPSAGSSDSSGSYEPLSFYSPIYTQLPTPKTNARPFFNLPEDIPPPSLYPFIAESEVIVDMTGPNFPSFAFDWSASSLTSSLSLQSELLGFPTSSPTSLDTDKLIEEFMNLNSWGSGEHPPAFADKSRLFF